MKIEAGMYSRMEHFILLVARNIRGNDRLFIHSSHDAHPFMEGVYEGGESEEVNRPLSSQTKSFSWS